MLLLSIATDTSFSGRVYAASLSDQTLMELLIENANIREDYRGGDGSFLDIKEWKGVYFNESGEITRISFSADIGVNPFFFAEECDDDEDEYLIIWSEGSIDLRWIPSTVKQFELSLLHVEGTVETSVLPSSLASFKIPSNQFQGTFCVASLPQTLQNVDISSNAMRGTLDMTKLPLSLETFSCKRNKFHGKLDFGHLPANLGVLHADHNAFSGKIDLSEIPQKMRFLSLHKTEIQQDCLVIRVPETGVPSSHFKMSVENFGTIVDTDGKDLKSGLMC